MIPVGKLDRRIVLQDYTTSRTTYGEETKTYSDTATIWAALRFGSGNERMVADKSTVVGDVIFTIRFRSGITEKTRISWDGNYWDIQHIAYLGRRQYIDLIATKVV